MPEQPKVLVVDDMPQNIRLLEAVLVPHGYAVVSATSGEEALAKVKSERPDLLLLDIVMPGMNGYEVCRRLRDDPETAFLPIVMVTASDAPEKLQAVEAGADDFIPKPFDQQELLARVRSLLRIKRYYDTIERQKAELAEWNRTLEERVHQQVEELEHMRLLRRFLSPQVADLVLSPEGERLLQPHRREIAVASGDLRGFTVFAEGAEPEEVMRVLSEYHETMGEIILRSEGTLKDITGDGFMVLFNDPLPCEDPAASAVRMAVEMRERVGELAREWRRHGYDLGFGVGIAQGYATLGRLGFEGRYDYGAVGRVVILAARLSSYAKAWQVLLSPRAHAAADRHVEVEPVGEIEIKGFARPVPVVNVVRLREPSATF